LSSPITDQGQEYVCALIIGLGSQSGAHTYEACTDDARDCACPLRSAR
jgi:hypothetical protein